MNEMDKHLPGGPSKRRIRDVRRHLKTYGITPKPELWRLAWEWAAKIADSYFYKHWPLPSEIASQYVLLLLMEMRGDSLLRLPYRAETQLPDSIRQRIGGQLAAPQTLMIGASLPERDGTA